MNASHVIYEIKTKGHDYIGVKVFSFKIMRFHFKNDVVSVLSILLGDFAYLLSLKLQTTVNIFNYKIAKIVRAL